MQKIEDLIQTYFDAIYECDADKIDQCFHQNSSLFDADEGDIFHDPIKSFRQDVATRPSPLSKHAPRKDEIILIDYLCAHSAVVKLRLRSHNNIFVDHLSILKGKDGWKIVAKTWHLENIIE